MAKNNRHNAAFVVGSVIGAVAGAAAALWKAPYTGEELRAKLTGDKGQTQESEVVVASPKPGATATMNTRQGERSIKDKVLSGVEKTLAPIVGVELGKTANGSGPATGSDIKVNADYTGSISNRKAWQGDASSSGTSTAKSADGTPIIGLSRDKIDADKWAAAYSGETNVPTTTKSDTASTTAAAAPAPSAAASGASSQVASGDSGWSKKRRAWDSDSGSATASTSTSADGTTIIGLSQDRVNADEWAAAYSGESTMSSPGSSGSNTGATRSQSDAVEESEAQTGLGAKPAYPGNEETASHAPANRTAPDTSVADVSKGSRNTGTIQHSTDEAATIEQLTSPQTNRIPDSLRQPTERSTHPFPKLGGKE